MMCRIFEAFMNGVAWLLSVPFIRKLTHPCRRCQFNETCRSLERDGWKNLCGGSVIEWPTASEDTSNEHIRNNEDNEDDTSIKR